MIRRALRYYQRVALLIFAGATTLSIVLAFSSRAEARLVLIGVKTEIAIGRNVAEELEAQHGVWNNAEQTQRVERIGKSMVAVCRRKDLPWQFKILNADFPNALAAPGGFIYITRPLLDILESDDELAFILGHEVGHVASEHSRKMISDAYASQILLGLLVGGQSGLVHTLVDFAVTLQVRGWGRNHERDADNKGAKYLKAVGYDPIAAITALKKLGGSKLQGVDKYLATHPDTPSRIKRLAKKLRVDPNTLQPLSEGQKVPRVVMPKKTVPSASTGSTESLLAFLRGNRIYTLNRGEKKPKEIWRSNGRKIEWFDWSPDGDKLWIAFRESDSDTLLIGRINLDGTGLQIPGYAIWPSGERPEIAVSFNGKWVAVTNRGFNGTTVRVFSVDQGMVKPLADRFLAGDTFDPVWLPDGRASFVSLKESGQIRFNAVGLIRPEGTPVLVQHFKGAQVSAIDRLIGWLPSTDHLLLVARDWRGVTGLYALDVQRERLDLVRAGVEDAAWDATGRIVVFVTAPVDGSSRQVMAGVLKGTADVLALSQTLDAARLLHHIEDEGYWLDVSSNGGQVALAVRDGSGWQVWLLSVGGKKKTVRPFLLDATQPRFAPY